MATSKRKASSLTRSQTRSNLQAVIRKALENIEKFGWHITGVFPTADDASKGWFAYTTGATTRKLPEIVITGVPFETSAGLINELLKSIESGKETLREDTPYTEICNMPIYLRKLTMAQVEGYMYMTGNFHQGKEYPVYQFVYPDPNGKFPWEDGYDFPPQVLLFKR